MKKILTFFAFAVIALSTSCVRRYDCSCSYLNTLGQSTVDLHSGISGSRREAQKACDNEEQALLSAGNTSIGCNLD